MPLEIPNGRDESNEVLEALRLRAVRARELGYALADIAAILGVREETISRWSTKYQQGGEAALPGPRTGRPEGVGGALSPAQAQRIQELLDDKTPQELGIAAALWTRRAVAELIQKELGLRLATRTVGKYLRRWGYTPQKPVRKAYKQDPEQVARWLEQEYPEIEQRAQAEGAEIHWGDETGVRSTCQHQRGYARTGETPELIVPGNRFSVNVISTITCTGTMRFMTYTGKMNAALFIVFLTKLVAGSKRKLFLIVDNLSVHEAHLVEQWLANKKEQLEIFYLPKYAPEYNPDEYLNCDIKGNINSDGLPKSREELHKKVRCFMHKLAKLPARIASYFKHKYIQYAANPEVCLS